MRIGVPFVLALALFPATAPFAVSALVPGPEGFDAVRRFADVQSHIEESNAFRLAEDRDVHALIALHREAIESCSTHAAFAQAVNRLIDDIGLSHFHYYPDNDWQYWHLRSALVDPSERSHVEHVGIIPEHMGDRWFVRGLLEGSPADDKGLAVGDELLSVDGVPYTPVNAFRGTAGGTVSVRLRRRAGFTYEVELAPRKESLHAAMQRASRESVRMIRHGGHVLAYLHGWTLLGDGAEYAGLLRMQDEVDGLLLDYRDGVGGTWFRAQRFLLGPFDQEFTGDEATWTKPVVILTGKGTRSAKEILVYQVKKAGRAPLVGEATPGHVISVGRVVEIEDDGLLMLPGMRFELEGKPISPDFLIPRDIRHCGGDDPQMEFARDLLSALIHRERQGGTGSWEDALSTMSNVTSAP